MYENMIPLFVSPFSQLRNIHGIIKGTSKLAHHLELLTGVKYYEVQLSLLANEAFNNYTNI